MTIAQRQTAQSASTLNPITAEIVRHALLSIPNQIDANIMRTAFSPLIYEYKDFAVGIVDAEGKLICQAKGGIPLFVANALGVAVRDGLAVHGADGIEDGDLLITNHAGTMGQHLNNVVMYTPIFAGPDKRDLFGFMAVLVHWIDIGGITVGSFLSSDTTSVFQEGIQYRSVKLWSRGKPQKDIYSIVQTNTRFPHMLMGDLESQIAGCLLGRTKVAEVIGKYGLDTVRASVEAMWDRSEASTRKALHEIPDGTYEAESFIDNDGVELDRRVPVRVVVHVAGDEMTVDFSGVAEQARGPINSGREGGAVAAARIALKYLAMPDEPPNDGCFRPLHVVIPDGKFISAGADAPLGAYSTVLPTVVDTIIRALVPAAPDRVAAGHHATMGLHAFEGRHENGELFQNVETSHGGWGASLGHDGAGPFKTMVHGDTRDVPVEVQEALYPLRIERLGFREDSGGAGEFRGAPGLEKITKALRPCEARISVERTGCPSWGILGGRGGARPETYILRPGQAPTEVLKGVVKLSAGDSVRVLSGGGGGYGDPLRRDPARVAEDVRRGIVTRHVALDVYGVELDETAQPMNAETAEQRETLRHRR